VNRGDLVSSSSVSHLNEYRRHKKAHPALFQQIFAWGFDAGLHCRDSFARKDLLARQAEAAELIADSGRNRAPVNYARVEGDNGATYVIPAY